MMKMLRDATLFASERHRGQFRKSKAPNPPEYVQHPLKVALILRDNHEIWNETILTAAMLHDVVEDTDTTLEEIRERFGAEVASLVEECTTDFPGQTVKQKRAYIAEHAPSWSYGAACIKIADSLDNISTGLVTLEPDWYISSQRGFLRTCTMVVEAVRDAGIPVPESLLEAFFAQVEETQKVLDERYAIYKKARKARKARKKKAQTAQEE